MEELLSIKGSFETSSIPELLYSLAKNKETCILKCKLLNYEKSIFLKEGKIVFATSNDPDERLGESLLKYGDITVSQYLEASKSIQPGKKLGSILCEMGAINAEHLLEALKRQVMDIIYSIFGWKAGEYELIFSDLENEAVILFELPVEPIIFNGIKQINYWSRISNGLSSVLNVPIKTPECDKLIMNINITEDENHILSLCNGNYDIQSICNMSYLSNLETCKLIWAFKAIGAISLISKKEESKESKEIVEAEYELLDIVESYNDILSFAYDFLNEKCPEQIDTIIKKSIDAINLSYKNRLQNIDLNYGRIDFDIILNNFSDLPHTEKRISLIHILEELIYTLLLQSKAYLAPIDHKYLLAEISSRKV